MNKEKTKTFYLYCQSVSKFTLIKEYLMKKYNVYTAIYQQDGYAKFRVSRERIV